MKTQIHLLIFAASILAVTVSPLHAQEGPGFALRFDGGSDSVLILHTNALNAFPLTVTTWLRTTQSVSFPFPPIVNKLAAGASNGWQVYLVSGNVRARYFADGFNYLSGNNTGLAGGLNGGSVADNVFHHVAFTVDAAGGSLYVDGVLRDSRAWVGTPGAPTTTEQIRLGLHNNASFIGTLDEVTVWNVALTQLEIQNNMHRSLAGTEPGLVAYYRFNEASGSTTADSAPAGGDNQGLVGGPARVVSGIAFVPSVTTLSPSALGTTTATLNGTANPNNASASGWFEFGFATNYGIVTPPQALGSGTSDTNFSQALSGLFGATYHFRAVASNSFGVVVGSDQSFALPAFYDIGAGLPGVGNSSVAWGDYDNDGRLDFLLTGSVSSASPTNEIAQIWRNTGSGFTHFDLITNNPFAQGISDGSVAWGDYNNDGRLDLLLSGFSALAPGQDKTMADVFQNSGSGFSGVAGFLPPVGYSSVAWGDYDNDGRLDFLLTGQTNLVISPTAGPLSEVWRNTGGFSKINAGLPAVSSGDADEGSSGSVAWGDYDNDGRPDILLAGAGIAQVRRNTGSGFTNINAGLPGVSSGSVAWGDYDNDGRLDILLTGISTNVLISQIWRNTGSGFTNINAGLPGVSFSSVAWGDYDNDGRLDILLTGGISQVWRNTGSGFTNINAGLPGVASSSAAWGDYDNDGRLDILLTGRIGSLRISQVWRNNTPLTNTPPTVPTGLSVTNVGTTMTLSWNSSSDGQTPASGLTYNVRVGTTPGGFDVFSPMSAATGLRRLPQYGNRQTRLFATFTATVGTPYYWSVQAIDNAFAGSSFAAESSFKLLQLPQPAPILVPVTTTNLLNGDLNGDGVFDETELQTLLLDFFASSPFLQLTNVAGLGGTNVTFALSNYTAGAFSVEYSTNLLDWLFLGPATPRYEFTDTNAPAVPQRYYRLRWP